jgi:hypothetical protein
MIENNTFVNFDTSLALKLQFLSDITTYKVKALNCNLIKNKYLKWDTSPLEVCPYDQRL